MTALSPAQPAGGVLADFRGEAYLRINQRRLEHLATLGLPLRGARVLEVGAGIGDLTGFFLDRGGSVLALEGREENAVVFRRRFRDVAGAEIRVVDLNAPPALGETFDVVFAYGILYHLAAPASAIAWMAEHCRDLLLLSTCVTPGDGTDTFPTAEDAAYASQALDGRGCRPTRAWVRDAVAAHLPHVYTTRTQPAHDEFPLDWNAVTPSRTGLHRAVFVGARRPLARPTLTEGLRPTHEPVDAGDGGAGATMPPLRASARNVHSQYGEDGIIEEILRRLGELDRPADRPLWCVEFGAWDGVHLSNTRHLIETHGARAVLIEPDRRRYRALVRNVADHPGVQTIRSAVGAFGPTRLDALLAPTACPKRFDVLSVDVDGHDLWVWHAVRSYEPLVVVIEYNPTIPYALDHPTPRDPAQRHGSSLGAFLKLGGRKGYDLVAVTETNAIFVRGDRSPALGRAEDSIDGLTEGLTDYRTFLFATPDGRVRVVGNRVMMWHGLVFDEAALQPLPRALRAHHDELGPVRRLMLRAARRLNQRRFDRRLAAEQRAWDRWTERARRAAADGER